MATDNVFKNSLVISNGTTSKAIQNVKSTITPAEALAFGNHIFGLAGTSGLDYMGGNSGLLTEAHLVRQIPLCGEKNLIRPGTGNAEIRSGEYYSEGLIPSIQLKWNDTVYTADKSTAAFKFTVKSTDEGVTSLGDHKYLFFVPCEQGDISLTEWVFCGTGGSGVYCGLNINNLVGSVRTGQFSYALMCYVDASDANKEVEDANYEDGKWKFWVSNFSTGTYADVYCNFYFEEVNGDG